LVSLFCFYSFSNIDLGNQFVKARVKINILSFVIEINSSLFLAFTGKIN